MSDNKGINLFDKTVPLYAEGGRDLANAVLEKSIRDKYKMPNTKYANLWYSLAGATYEYYCEYFDERMVSKERFNISKVPLKYRELFKEYVSTDEPILNLSTKYGIHVNTLYKLLNQYNAPHRRKYGGGSCKK